MNRQLTLREFLAIPMVFLVSVTLFSQMVRGAKPSDSQHGARYQPLNMKPGLWERTSTSTVAGEMPIPTEMLNSLTPDQRARIEERMKANSAAHTRTTTDKSCVTKQELEKPFNPGDKECTWTILESTSTKAKGTVSCEASGMKMRGSGEFEAPDPEHLKGSMHAASTGGGHNMTVDGTFTSKWLGASCGNTQ